MTFTPQSLARDLLTRMGYPISLNNMSTVLAWEYAEGGHFHNNAHFNPLNTTREHGKYPAINADGVASYPDYRTGMAETVATLRLPAYAAIRADLKGDVSPQRTTTAIATSPWGTWHGSSPRPLVERATRELHAHPSWYAPAKHRRGGSTGGGAAKKPGAGDGARGAKVVLDLQELRKLSQTYQQASDRVLQRRRGIQDLAASIDAARRALPDPAIANAIAANFAYVTDPQVGLDRDARLMDELSAYLGDIHRLAEQTDSDKNGKWTKKEARAFAKAHGGDGKDPATRAVLEALRGGTIYKTSKAAGAGAGAQSGAGAGGSRAQKIGKMLDVARQQHAQDGGSNHTKYGAWFGTNGVAWCAQFVSYVFAHSGNQLPAIDGAKGFQYCPDAINYARAHHQLHNTAHVGDIFLRKDGQHTGIVSRVHADGTFETIEGNAGPQTDRVVHGQRNSPDGIYYFWTAIK